MRSLDLCGRRAPPRFLPRSLSGAAGGGVGVAASVVSAQGTSLLSVRTPSGPLPCHIVAAGAGLSATRLQEAFESILRKKQVRTSAQGNYQSAP